MPPPYNKDRKGCVLFNPLGSNINIVLTSVSVSSFHTEANIVLFGIYASWFVRSGSDPGLPVNPDRWPRLYSAGDPIRLPNKVGLVFNGYTYLTVSTGSASIDLWNEGLLAVIRLVPTNTTGCEFFPILSAVDFMGPLVISPGYAFIAQAITEYEVHISGYTVNFSWKEVPL